MRRRRQAAGPGAARRALARWLAAAAAALPLCAGAAERWKTYEQCRLDESYASNDGDSFLVQCGRRRYLFRLYFVDAPETDESFPERVQEQADYWGLDRARVLALGAEARRFTATFLKQPFTVRTKWDDARGRSDRQRYFAVVESDGRSLAAELVAAGLARVYGAATALPDGTPAAACWKALRRAEAEARKAGLGAWRERRPARPPLKPPRDRGAGEAG